MFAGGLGCGKIVDRRIVERGIVTEEADALVTRRVMFHQPKVSGSTLLLEMPSNSKCG